MTNKDLNVQGKVELTDQTALGGWLALSTNTAPYNINRKDSVQALGGHQLLD